LVSSAGAQSFFSSRGFGEEITNSDAASGALGGLFTASSRNPAYPVGTPRTSFTASALVLGNYATDDANRRVLGDVRPNFLRVRVPLPVGLRLNLGLSEWFNQDFDVYSESLAQYRRHVVGKGGIYDINAGLAYSLFKTVTLGAEYSRLFGGSTELWRFDAYEGNYVTYDTVQYNYAGDAMTLGLFAQRGILSLGGFFQPVLDFNLNSWVRTHGTVAESAAGVKVGMPARYGAGLGISPTPSLRFYLEGARREGSRLTIADSTRPEFRNSLQVVLGVQYMLDEAHPLRLGLRWNDWYLNATGGKPVQEIALTGGSSFPIAGLGSFDFSLEYINRRAVTQTGTLQEHVARAGLTLYFEEPWNARRRRWGY